MRHPRSPEAIARVTRTGHPVPMILDADTGIDDSLALLYAAACPGIDLLAVTTCAGNVELDHVVHNTLGVLELAGAHHVEVARGASQPVARPLETTPQTHGPAGLGHATVAPTGSVSERSAVEVIVETARSRPGEVTLVTMGPLTNLASAVLAEPRLPRLLRDVFVMGGTFQESGNVSPRVEWNIHVDPEAARTVFHQWSVAGPSGAVPLTLMGLDVTETSVIRARDLVAVAAAAGLPVDRFHGLDDVQTMATAFGHPVLDFLRDALRFYFEFHLEADGFYGAHVHDPYVVGAAVDPGLVEVAPTVVDVDLGGTWTAGETIADWRGHLDRPVNAWVGTSGRGAEFLQRWCTVLSDLVRADPRGRPSSSSSVAPE